MFKKFFAPEPAPDLGKEGLARDRIPRHIAVIMDGNGRWAQQQGRPRTFGHQAGAKTLKTILRYCGQLGVEALTAYAFSTENWKRPLTEVNFIMELFSSYLDSEVAELDANNVRLRFSGDSSRLAPALQRKMGEAVRALEHNSGIVLNLAVNYGGRAELLRAVQAIAAQVQAGKLRLEDIDEACVEGQLYTAGLPAPDLLIRTGGDLRVSNFLLWQIAYAELWTTPVYWPDFTPQLLEEAIAAYQGRERRYGGLKNKK